MSTKDALQDILRCIQSGQTNGRNRGSLGALSRSTIVRRRHSSVQLPTPSSTTSALGGSLRGLRGDCDGDCDGGDSPPHRTPKDGDDTVVGDCVPGIEAVNADFETSVSSVSFPASSSSMDATAAAAHTFAGDDYRYLFLAEQLAKLRGEMRILAEENAMLKSEVNRKQDEVGQESLFFDSGICGTVDDANSSDFDLAASGAGGGRDVHLREKVDKLEEELRVQRNAARSLQEDVVSLERENEELQDALIEAKRSQGRSFSDDEVDSDILEFRRLVELSRAPLPSPEPKPRAVLRDTASSPAFLTATSNASTGTSPPPRLVTATTCTSPPPALVAVGTLTSPTQALGSLTLSSAEGVAVAPGTPISGVDVGTSPPQADRTLSESTPTLHSFSGVDRCHASTCTSPQGTTKLCSSGPVLESINPQPQPCVSPAICVDCACSPIGFGGRTASNSVSNTSALQSLGNHATTTLDADNNPSVVQPSSLLAHAADAILSAGTIDVTHIEQEASLYDSPAACAGAPSGARLCPSSAASPAGVASSVSSGKGRQAPCSGDSQGSARDYVTPPVLPFGPMPLTETEVARRRERAKRRLEMSSNRSPGGDSTLSEFRTPPEGGPLARRALRRPGEGVKALPAGSRSIAQQAAVVAAASANLEASRRKEAFARLQLQRTKTTLQCPKQRQRHHQPNQGPCSPRPSRFLDPEKASLESLLMNATVGSSSELPSFSTLGSGDSILDHLPADVKMDLLQSYWDMKPEHAPTSHKDSKRGGQRPGQARQGAMAAGWTAAAPQMEKLASQSKSRPKFRSKSTAKSMPVPNSDSTRPNLSQKRSEVHPNSSVGWTLKGTSKRSSKHRQLIVGGLEPEDSMLFDDARTTDTHSALPSKSARSGGRVGAGSGAGLKGGPRAVRTKPRGKYDATSSGLRTSESASGLAAAAILVDASSRMNR